MQRARGWLNPGNAAGLLSGIRDILTSMGVSSAAATVADTFRGSSPAPARVYSVDVLRGLTMAVMIFVNDVSGVKGIPWWTYHMDHMVPPRSGMTYVDVVFPTFLFVLGMAIPFALRRRMEQGISRLRLWAHILMRSLSLVVLGLILANAEKADPKLTGLPEGAWPTIALLGAILFWLDYPKNGRQTLYRILKYAGLAILIASLAIFRETNRAGQAGWLDFGYWEILGLIGRVYLAACILYFPVRNIVWAPAAIFVGLNALNVASRLGMPSLDRFIPYAVWPFDNGELPSIAFAGIVTYQIFFDERVARTFRKRALLALAFAAVLFAGGWTFTFLGISKNAATPAWCLYCSGIGVTLFLAIYWLVDVHGWRKWAAFVKPAGSNTLLTYLLPDLYYYTLGAAVATLMPGSGWPGVVKSLVFTAFILFVSYLLTRKRIRMQL